MQSKATCLKKIWQDTPDDSLGSLGMDDTLDYGEGDGLEEQEDEVDTAVDSIPLDLVPDDWLEDCVAGDGTQERGGSFWGRGQG